MKSRLIQYVADILRSPRESLTRGQHFVRHSIELTVHCWRQLQRHRAEGMAAELTYRTIFSLIPVVVLGLVMFRVFGGLDEVQTQVENQLYSFFGVPEIAEGYERPLDESTSSEDFSPSDPSGERNDQPSDDQGINEDAGDNAEQTDPNLPSDEPTQQPTSEPPVPPSETANGTEDVIPDTEQAITSVKDEVIARAEAEAEAKAAQKTRASIRSTLHDITTQVSQVDFKSIGVFGLLLFIYAAIALADSTEDVFNRIYDASSQRPIHLRFAIHWSIITVGSGLLAMSLYLSGQVVDRLSEISFVSNFQYTLNHLLSITASWVLLFLLYALMPNTSVSVRAAAIGSLVGSLLWETAKFGFQIYVVKAVPYSAIYGSIGLIPLFLFWIYVTWLIILFGLILTYTLQVLQGRSLGEVDVDESNRDMSGDPDWMLPITWEVGHAFEAGHTIDDQSLSERLGLPAHVVRQMTGRLADAGLVRRVKASGSEPESLTLARPAEKIRLCEILSLAHQGRPTNQHPAWRPLADLKKAEREAASDQTLKDVMQPNVDLEEDPEHRS